MINGRLLATLVACLFLSACDDETPKVTSPSCVGTNASFTQATFDAAATTGACANPSDLTLACSTDLTSIVGTCGSRCYLMNSAATPAELATCTATCVKADPGTATDPSDACLGCYLQSVGCTLQNCLAQCAAGTTTSACIACRETAGCTAAFFTCSGLPVPAGADGGI